MTGPLRLSPTEGQVARPLARGFGVLTSTRAMILALQFVAFALMASRLGPHQLGVYVFALAFAGLFTLVTDFGFQPTVAREVAQRPEDESWLLPNLSYLRLSLACLGYVLVVVALGVIGYGEATRRAGLLAGLTLFVSAFDGFGVAQQVRLRMSTVALGGLTQAALMLVGVLALGATAYGVDSYILLTIGASLANSAVVTAGAIHVARFRWRPLPSTWMALLRAALPLGLASGVIALYYRLDLLILARLKSADAVGQYGAGYKFIDTLNVLPAMVVTVLGPVFARSVVGSGDILQRRYRQAIHLIWLLALPIGLIGAMTAFRVLPMLPGFEHYRGAGRALAILAPAGALIIISTVLSSVLVSGGQQRRLLRTSLVVLVVSVAFDLALIPTLSYAGAAIATVITEAMTVSLSLWMIHRHLGLRWPISDVARTVPAILVTTGVLVVSYSTGPFEQVGLGLTAYVLCLVVTPALHVTDVPGLFQRPGPVTFIMGRPCDRQAVDELCAGWPNDGRGWRWVVLGSPDEQIGSVAPYDTDRFSGRRVLRLRRIVRGSSACVLTGLDRRQRAIAQLVVISAWCRPVVLAAAELSP